MRTSLGNATQCWMCWATVRSPKSGLQYFSWARGSWVSRYICHLCGRKLLANMGALRSAR